MAEEYLFKRKLSYSEMHGIVRCAENSHIPATAALVYFYVRIARIPWPFKQEIEVMRYAIPKGQWGEICEAIGRGQREHNPGSISTVNSMLSWMNKGPSAYDH